MIYTIAQSLQGANPYPVPETTIATICAKRGYDPQNQISEPVIAERGYNLAVADVLMYISCAPNISQGGQSYSLTDEMRAQLRKRARAIYLQFGESVNSGEVQFGYKGSRL